MIDMHLNSWATFKSTVIESKKLSYQYSETGERYFIYGAEQSIFLWQIVLMKDGGSDVIDWENNYKSKANKPLVFTDPFAGKIVGDKSLFNRTHGAEFSLSAGSNNLIFAVPYNVVKFNGLEIIGGELGDYADLNILDTDGDPTTPYYGTADAKLNQFGYDVVIRPGFFERESKYDADLLLNMQIEIVYISESAKTLYVNYLLHELK